jgi:ABC-type polysaccharide/polyol phosphate export permease
MKILLIPFFAYVSFGSILESETSSYEVPYRAFVLSGLLPWLIFTILIGESLRIWSSPGRRRFLLRPNSNSLSSIFAALLAYWPIIIFTTVILGWYIYRFAGFTGSLLRFALCTTLIVSFICISVLISWIIGLLSAATRDIRQMVPYLLTGVLFVSPIYFESRRPDSTFEFFLVQINLFSRFLELVRNVSFGESPKLTHAVFISMSLFALTLPFFLFQRFRIACENYVIHAFSQPEYAELEED